jgi:hypothetical protein
MKSERSGPISAFLHTLTKTFSVADYLPRPALGRCSICQNSGRLPEDLKLPHPLLRCETRLSDADNKGGAKSERQKQEAIPSSSVSLSCC